MILRHKVLDLEITFYTAIGSHLLGERSGWFAERVKNAKAVLIDNGVFALLRDNRRVGPRELVKYAVKNILSVLELVRKHDLDIYIVVPDYPFDKRLNHECYRVFKQHYSHLAKDYHLVYVLHGYWEAILDGVDVDLVAIPYNTLSDCPIKSLIGRKSFTLDEIQSKYVVARTIEHCKQYGYHKVHLLGPTGKTLRTLFKPVDKPFMTLDGIRISNDFMQHIVSFDTTCWHKDPDAKPCQRKILIEDRSKEPEWVQRWLSKTVQWFEIEKW